MKKTVTLTAATAAKLACAAMTVLCLFLYTDEAAQGVKNGLNLCAQAVIPSLLPCMVISGYIVNSDIKDLLARLFGAPIRALFNINKNATAAILTGFTGGYPVGAISTAQLYAGKKISQNEAQRLMLFTVNGGPAFVIITVGHGMLGNMKSGAVIYASVIVASVLTGVFLRFFGEKADTVSENEPAEIPHAFALSVTESSRAIYNICTWVLTFACVGGVLDAIIKNEYSRILIKSLLEVTTGCGSAAGNLPAGAIAGITSFGGISVICQILPYAEACGVQLKRLICFRAINAALSAFIAMLAFSLLPPEVVAVYAPTVSAVPTGGSLAASAALMMMCGLFVLDIENTGLGCYNREKIGQKD